MFRLLALAEILLVLFVILLFYRAYKNSLQQKALKREYNVNTQEDIDTLVQNFRVKLEQKKIAYGEQSEKYKQALKNTEEQIEKVNKIKITN